MERYGLTRSFQVVGCLAVDIYLRSNLCYLQTRVPNHALPVFAIIQDTMQSALPLEGTKIWRVFCASWNIIRNEHCDEAMPEIGQTSTKDSQIFFDIALHQMTKNRIKIYQVKFLARYSYIKQILTGGIVAIVFNIHKLECKSTVLRLKIFVAPFYAVGVYIDTKIG